MGLLVGSACTGPASGGLQLASTPLSSPFPHGPRSAGEAEVDQLPPEQGGVATTLRPAPFKTVAIRCKNAHPRRLAPERGATGPKPAPDRLAVGAEFGGDARDGNACRVQPCSFLVARVPPGTGCQATLGCRTRLATVRLGDRYYHGQNGCLLADLLGSASDSGVLTINHGADGIAEVAQQVPPICNLDRIRRTLPHAVRVGTGPVARDNLDAWVLMQPPCQSVGLAVGQKVDHRVALQIDEDRAVATAAAPSPVVNGKDARNARRLSISAGLAYEPQQRVRAGRHGQPLGQAHAGFAAQQPARDGIAGRPAARSGVRRQARCRTGARRRSAGSKPG